MENQTIQEKVKQYLELYDEVRQRTGDERVALAVMQELSKDHRVEEMKAERAANRKNGNDFVPATIKQIMMLLSLKVRLPDQLSKQEASQLIEEAKTKT